MSNILMFSHKEVFSDGKTFGPSIRLWELAKALIKKGHKITIVEKNRKKEETKEDIKFIEYNAKYILKNISKYDVAFIQLWFNDKEFLSRIKIPIVVDVYAPYLLEHIHYDYKKTDDDFWRFTDDILLSTLIPFQYGDYFICTSERQKHYYLGLLAALGRLNPYNRNKDLVGIVPFGVKTGKPNGNKKILREVIPKNKKIILWLSTFFNWLDPMQAAKIMYELSKKSDDYVLAIVGAKSPFVYKKLYEENYDKFYKFVKDKKMLDKSVFFFDYVNYTDVDSIYNESELFIATYRQDILETQLSYRTRVSEAMYGRLPVIVSGGDIVSDFVKEYNTGIVIDSKLPSDVANEILSLDDENIEVMKNNIEKFLKKNTWDNLIGPLDAFCRKPYADKTKREFMFEKLIGSRRELFLYLRDERDKKIGEIDDLKQENELNKKSYDVQLDNLKQEIEIRKKREIELKEKIHELEKLLIERDAEINDFQRMLIDIRKENNIIIEKKNEIITEKDRVIEIVIEKNKEFIKEKDEKEDIISELKKKIGFLEGKLGDIRHSITYPLYKITHSFGKTNFGKILQKLFK